jgi:hypothetical protein
MNCLASNFSAAKILYFWDCAACEAKEGQSISSGPGYCIPNPVLPDGWIQIDRKFFCPKHRVVLMADDRQIAF